MGGFGIVGEFALTNLCCCLLYTSYQLSKPEKTYKDWTYDTALQNVRQAIAIDPLPIYIQMAVSYTHLDVYKRQLTFDINPDNYEITVQYQNGKYSLMGQNADEFPQSATLGDNAGLSYVCTHHEQH